MFLVSSVTELSNSFYTGRERVGGSNLIKSLFEMVASEILMRIHYSITLPWCKHANVSEEISKLKQILIYAETQFLSFLNKEKVEV